MAEILKGAPVAAALSEELIARAEKLKQAGTVPTLAILRLGERPDDISYETGAMKRCDKIGIAVKHFLLPENCTKERLLDTIREINADGSIHGCLMFRPLPDKDMEAAACALLAPEKDVDCMTSGSLASVFTGKGAGYPPCTAQACIELLDHYGVSLTGRRVAVIGRSLVIGKPVAMMLQQRNATVTMCHTRTVDMPGVCRGAEIIIAAAGKAGVVDRTFAAPGQVLVDVGINVDENGKLCGDVKFDEVEPVAAAITPVPGGVGAVTTAVLAKHVIEAAEKAQK
nr:tetrahydrofolate dehydrogenase/cyclohydrolase catalytic domain-containing protein [uncultured Oscillibacter sp.]